MIQINPIFGALLGVVLLVLLGFFAYRALPGMIAASRSRWENRNIKDNFFGLELSIVSWLWTVFIGLVFLTGILYFIAFIIFHLGNMGTTYQVELFNLINGRWEFTLEETTFGLVSLDFGGANFRHSIIWWILLTLIFNTIMTNTPYGNSVFAVGGNSGAARAQGIDVDRIKIINYMLIGLLVAIAAIFEVARNPGVDPLKGLQWELEMVAMTVIGGALLTGGYGSVIGTLLGAVIFGMLQTGLVLVGMNARLFQGVIGVITIGAVVLNTSVRRIPTK